MTNECVQLMCPIETSIETMEFYNIVHVLIYSTYSQALVFVSEVSSELLNGTA